MHKRVSERFECSLPVQACTTVETRPAVIVDLSTHGARVHLDDPYEQGERIHIDVDGDFIWATVAWSEIDRMGVKFTVPLPAGHRLAMLIEDQRRRIPTRTLVTPASAGEAAAPVRRGFGRKSA